MEGLDLGNARILQKKHLQKALSLLSFHETMNIPQKPVNNTAFNTSTRHNGHARFKIFQSLNAFLRYKPRLAEFRVQGRQKLFGAFC
jgi:hypothetical protein